MEQLNEISVAEELFKTLNALKPNEVTSYIHTFCNPDSERYQLIESKRLEEPMAYVCLMLIASDINQFSEEWMSIACKYLQEKYPASSFNETLAWIYTLNRTSQNKIMFGQNLKSIHNAKPFYMNYSGLDFGILETVENINFSNTNCRRTSFDEVEINNCDFSNANISGAYFRVRGGKGCNFSNVLCDKTYFVRDLDAELATLTNLHTLLTTSKGRNTIKAGIVDDIIRKLADKPNAISKKELLQKLKAHPFFSEHRNNLFGGLNKILPGRDDGNMIQTNSQNKLSALEPQRKNTKTTWVSYTTDSKGTKFNGHTSEYGFIDDTTLEVTNPNNEDSIFDVKDLTEKEDAGWGCILQ